MLTVWRNALQVVSIAVVLAPAAQASAGKAISLDEGWQVAQAAPSTGRTSPSRGGTSGFTCGTKRVCGDMGSCAEARFHYEQCGLSRLDGDRDGVPCERLCK